MNSISPTPTQDQQHIGGGLESVNLGLLKQSPGPLSSKDELKQGAELCSRSPTKVLSLLATGFKYVARALAILVGALIYAAGLIASQVLTVVSLLVVAGPGVFGALIGALVMGIVTDRKDGNFNTSTGNGVSIGFALPWAVIQVGLGVPRALCGGVGLLGAGLLSFGLNKEFKKFAEPIRFANFDLSISLSMVGLIKDETA